MTGGLVTVQREAPRLLHLGCGRRGHDIEFFTEGMDTRFQVTTLDADPLLEPDLICTLGRQQIPLADDSVDLAIAIHVLEHIGKQGETDEWFYFWEELYRVMKPGAILRFESPLYNSVWAWADPQHCRALSPQAFIYFDQDHYRIPNSAITPYRVRCDFVARGFAGIPDSNPQVAEIEEHSHFRGQLEARKPFKPWWLDGTGNNDQRLS